jgi:hypothetical protein
VVHPDFARFQLDIAATPKSCIWDDIGGARPVHLTDAQWSDLVTDGGMLNGVWKSRLDAVAPYFQQLQAAGMAALFRPQHEMNQGVFWWGGRPGQGGTSALFQVTHDYLLDHWGLDNIVWVWGMQGIWDSSTNSYDFDQYNPGDSYWDVMSLDFYDGTGYTDQKYQAMLAEAGNKPIAIGEREVLPTPDELTAQPRWVYFMGWAELIQQNDSNAQITATYTAPSVLTQDKMPVVTGREFYARAAACQNARHARRLARCSRPGASVSADGIVHGRHRRSGARRGGSRRPLLQRGERCFRPLVPDSAQGDADASRAAAGRLERIHVRRCDTGSAVPRQRGFRSQAARPRSGRGLAVAGRLGAGQPADISRERIRAR